METSVGVDDKFQEVSNTESNNNALKPYTGKKRGRKPKTEQEKLEAAEKRRLLKQQKTDDKNMNTNTENPLQSSTSTEPNSTDVQNELINRQALAHLYHRREVVCDRCNSLRRACFGTLSSCNNCLIANKECTSKRPRVRKSKPRKLKAVNMDISLDQSVDLSQMVPIKPISIENDKIKELEDTVAKLNDELRAINQEKKLGEEHYKELETENDYLKETISTLQLLFKEQQNLVQLLEKQQIQNLKKLKMLQDTKKEQHHINPPQTRNFLNPDAINKTLSQHNSLQFQLRSQDRKEWLMHLNSTSTVNSPPNGSTAHQYSNIAHSESTHTKNVSPQSNFMSHHDLEANRLSYEQVQAQLIRLNNTKVSEENEVNNITNTDLKSSSINSIKTNTQENNMNVQNINFSNHNNNLGFQKNKYQISNARKNSDAFNEDKSKISANNDMDLYIVM
ncbi:uncharacterized protein HGUI_01180 [Hanseniaspora guilliermondii]|uniref:Zn(2)-C6 fungal-type domain-containing protein n=1 Tax=Hanseniaspora guilliermondii TaxID=56406 RepID=A0A1L0AZL9_9ASCO|nr:uncharacterized protein HGUI_01180 [Hanseniaspora guilliermondii]